MPGGPRAVRGWPGPTLSDALLVLASLALIISLTGPYLRWTRFERRVTQVVLNVDSVRTAALRYRERNGTWPESAPAGEAPPGLASELSPRVGLASDGVRLVWRRWSVMKPRYEEPAVTFTPPDTLVSTAPALDSLGSISVRTPNESLLAALLLHYGSAASFARDSSWTLIVRPEPRPSRTDSIG